MKILLPRIVEEGCFVYGSNQVGMSFSGAAKTAVEQYGAQLGVSFGFTGQAFAIPTKDANIKPLYIRHIQRYVQEYLKIAAEKEFNLDLPGNRSTIHKPLELYYKHMFMCTKIGCGLAGFTSSQIAPFFMGATSNITFDTDWKPFLGETASDGEPRLYWGSYSE